MDASGRMVRSAMLLGLALLLAAAGCAQPVTPEARKLLVAGREAYQRGDDDAAISSTSAFLADFSRSEEADVAYYLRGLARYRKGNTSDAKTDLKFAAATTDRQDIRLGALKALGDLVFEEGDMDWAETLYRQALAETRQGVKPADEIRYRLGAVLQRQGRWNEADEQFDRVVHLFGGTELADRAERRLRCIAWTVQAGAYVEAGRANAEAARLRAKGLSAVTRPVPTRGRLLHVVQVGWHERYADAAAALPEAKKLRSDAHVVPTR